MIEIPDLENLENGPIMSADTTATNFHHPQHSYIQYDSFDFESTLDQVEPLAATNTHLTNIQAELDQIGFEDPQDPPTTTSSNRLINQQLEELENSFQELQVDELSNYHVEPLQKSQPPADNDSLTTLVKADGDIAPQMLVSSAPTPSFSHLPDDKYINDYTINQNFSFSNPTKKSAEKTFVTPLYSISSESPEILQQQPSQPPQMTPTLPIMSPSTRVDPRRLTLSNGDEFSSVRKGLATESKTPAEYTLHILFTQFVRHAERKLNLCLNYPLDDEPPIVDLLAEGIDPNFDKIIASLGYIARRKPKPVIDSVMFWRKSKSEVATMAAAEVERTISLTRTNSTKQTLVAPTPPHSLLRSKSLSRLQHRRNKSSLSSTTPTINDLEYTKRQNFLENQIQNARETAIQAERKSMISIYVLFRVLIEVVKQAPLEIIETDLGDKLEEIVFTQLKTTDPLALSESLIRSSNWNLFAELLGHMSQSRFLTVSDRFIMDLEKVPSDIEKQDEPRLHLLIHGMRYLKLINYPLDKFEEGAEFLQSIGKFFYKSNNESIQLAYCEVISNLVLPLANILSAEVNHPTWVEAIEMIYKKASQLLEWRPKNWEYVINLITSMLSVAPKELFQGKWFSLIEDNCSKLKPKVSIEQKTMFITCVSRLVWVFLYRCTDSLNNTIRCLDNLFDILFFNSLASSKKQQWISSDLSLVQSLVQLLRCVGYSNLNYTFENVLIRLFKLSFNGVNLENICQERIIVIIKSYISILNDYGLQKKRPDFPTNETISSILDGQTTQKQIRAGQEIFAKDSSNLSSHEEISKMLSILLQLLDSNGGVSLWNGQTPITPSYKSGSSPFSGFHFGSDFQYQMARNLNTELFATVIESAPWCLSSSSIIPFRQLVDILARNSVHSDFRVATAATNALKALASRKNAGPLITQFSKIAFQFNDKPNPSSNSFYTTSNEYQRLLKLYVDLLQCWLKTFMAFVDDDAEVTNSSGNLEFSNEDLDLYQVNVKPSKNVMGLEKKKATDELELKNIITVIEEVEGNGLFFVCSQDWQIRNLGLSILGLIDKFDQAIYSLTNSSIAKSHSRTPSKFAADIGTRLIHVLEDLDLSKLLKDYQGTISIAEKNRLSKLKRKNIVPKLAGSSSSIDAALFLKCFNQLVGVIFQLCPVSVAYSRNTVCNSIISLYDTVCQYSNNENVQRNGDSPPPELVIEQWKLYLIFACSTLTSTNDQKISFPSQPTHGRKRSNAQMFIQHQKITSAKSIFRMVLPLLKSDHTLVRDSVVIGLSCININIFHTFLETIEPLMEWDTSLKSGDENRLRIEIVHILSNVTKKLNDEDIYSFDKSASNLMSIIKNLKTFLSLPRVQVDIEYQRLRRYFSGLVENVFFGIQKVCNQPEKWISFEARVGCFTFLKEWCGYGEYSQIYQERYNHMINKLNLSKDSASLAAMIEIERNRLELASISCMASLCSGPIMEEINGSAVISFDIPGLLHWIDALFNSRNEKIRHMAKIATKNILTLNYSSRQVVHQMIQKCYNSTSSYFVVFAEAYMTVEMNCKPYEPVALALYLIGNQDYEIRTTAIKLLKYIEEHHLNNSTVEQFVDSVHSKAMTIYKRAVFSVSSHFAKLYPTENFSIISTLTMYFHSVDGESRRDILAVLLPWVQSVELKYQIKDQESEVPSEDTQLSKETTHVAKPKETFDVFSSMVLNNLFEITIKFSSTIQNEVEALWVALGNSNNNIEKILDFIITNSIQRRNPTFVEYSRQIIDYLSYSQPESIIIPSLMANLQPKSMVPPQYNPSIDSLPKEDSTLPYICNLWKILDYTGKDSVLSLGQLSVVFLVDLFAVPNEVMRSKLPLLLHISFVLLDHYLPIVQEQAGEMLIHLIHQLAPNEAKTPETIDMLRKRDRESLWIYDDLHNDKNGARTPKNMDLLVRNVLEIFSPLLTSNLQQEWSRVSLSWATTCAVRHIACRSFQIFRCLLSFLDQAMLRDMLHRLSNTIADETLDIQGFAMQILMTLNAITAELDSEKLIDFPQLFWCSVACLSTIHEQEFIEVLSSLSKFVSKIDLDSPDTVSCLISTFPPKWEGKFEGLQTVVMIGLRSSNSWDASLKFLDRLNKLNDSEIIGSGDRRVLMALLANMPRFLHSLDFPTLSSEIVEVADNLSQMAITYNKPALSRILTSFAKSRFRSKNDFMSQIISCINNGFFPQFEAQTLVFLLGLLSNKIKWVKLETMELLKHILPLVDLQRDEFVGVGADLISPLLRLLLTDYAEEALEVLDETVIISGSQLDKDVLRMSLGNKSIRKEYDKTATLFGIPDESGWSIPMPAVTAASTRNNVHAVFSTCVVPANTEEEIEQTENAEEIQFHMEDYSYQPLYNGFEYGDNISITQDEPDASLSNLWAALDDFDSFFTKDTGDAHHLHHHNHNTSVDTKYSTTSTGDTIVPMDSAPQVYDKKVSVILNRSLARTQSNASFRTSLADSITNNNDYSKVTTRRNYIPFRSNRIVKNSPVTHGFESNIITTELSSMRSPSPLTSPSNANFASSTNQQLNGSRNSVSPPLNQDPSFRLESLLHSGTKKQKKKSSRFSSNNAPTTPTITMPDSPSNWNNNGKFSSQAPPASLSNSPSLSGGKTKDKVKKPSQKSKN